VDLDTARELVDGARDAELFLYPGAAHLFTDATTAEHDPAATEQVLRRSLRLLERWS
jgi:dienelactone hydrolase